MIRVTRGNAPKALSSAAVRQFRAEARKFFSVPLRRRRQRKYAFPVVSRDRDILAALDAAFHGKCAYCESSVSGESHPLDHFRPRQGAMNGDGGFSPDHYWWLVLDWENLYQCCRECNQFKGQRFPIAGRRARFPTSGEALARERPLLLDPCRDEPDEHLVFQEDGRVASETERGQVTIEVLSLNRPDLVERRRKAASELAGEIAKAKRAPSAARSLKERLEDPAQGFLGMQRQLARRHVPRVAPTPAKAGAGVDLLGGFLGALLGGGGAAESATKTIEQVKRVFSGFLKHEETQDDYSVEQMAGVKKRRAYFLRTRFVRRVELYNVKGIRQLSLDLAGPREQYAPWTMILGENSTGKSTLLQAVALALVGEKARKALRVDPASFVRHRCRTGSVRVFLTGRSRPLELGFRAGQDAYGGGSSEAKVLVLAYGATRLLPRVGTRGAVPGGLFRARNLFNPFVPLVDAEAFLRSLPPARFDLAARALKDLLVLGDQDRIVRLRGKRKGIEVRMGRSRASLAELSDGYQSVVALAVDMMSILFERWNAMEIAEGIVLLDELGAHLHPRWKMEVVGRLRRIFPRVQFIVTTHDPLCLRGLVKGEVVVMRRDAHDEIYALTDLPSPEGLRVDQLLTSEHFGLSTTVDPDLERAFRRYYELLAARDPGPKDRRELEALRKELADKHVMGETPRDRLVLEATDEALARRQTERAPEERERLKAQARERLKAILETALPSGERAAIPPSGAGDP